MSDGERTESATNSPMFSAYGIAATALGLLAVAAVALGALVFSGHRGQVDERNYQTRVLAAAAEFTGVLINMNVDNIDASLRRLHEDAVGQLSVEFESAVQPYRQVVEKLKSHSAGAVEAVAIESVRHDSGAAPGSGAPDNSEPLPREIASRVDTVVVVATSSAQNAAGKPQTVNWNLRLDVADVSGTLMISKLGSIR